MQHFTSKKQLNQLLVTSQSSTRQQPPFWVQLLPTGHSLEGLVCELLHFLAKQLLGSVAEHVMQVTSRPAPSVAQKLVPAHAGKPAPAWEYKRRQELVNEIWSHAGNLRHSGSSWNLERKELQSSHCIKRRWFHIAQRHVLLLQHSLNLSCKQQLVQMSTNERTPNASFANFEIKVNGGTRCNDAVHLPGFSFAHVEVWPGGLELLVKAGHHGHVVDLLWTETLNTHTARWNF